MAISLDKVREYAPDLVKKAESAKVALEGHGLSGEKAKVALVLDHSLSMRRMYQGGIVQATAERILALATQFDDDGDIDIFVFDSNAEHVGSLSLTDYRGGVGRLIGNRVMGSTNYADAIATVLEFYGFGDTKRGFFGRRKAKATPDMPVYVVFITDGEPDSRPEAQHRVAHASTHPVFFQFVGVGGGRFDFLTALDDMPGRAVDNAGFMAVADPSAWEDDRLYGEMLNEFPKYLVAARVGGILV